MLLIFYIDFRVLLCYYDYNGKEGCNISASGKEKTVPLVYKEDVLTALKDHGYNTTKLRKERLLSEGAIQSLREKKPISWANIEKLCQLMECQPNNFLEYCEDSNGQIAPYFFPCVCLRAMFAFHNGKKTTRRSHYE